MISDADIALCVSDNMPPSSVDADALRRRATNLRHLANVMSTTDAVDLRLRADADVWLGPTATRCFDDLAMLGRRLVGAADELIVRARALERRAIALDVVALGSAT
jgi:hypothetical protein